LSKTGDIKPKNISIDTLSRAFAGNEIDRVQVYAFAMHMQALAMVASGSVTILSHPSLQGMSSGSGLSGSTAWHGAFRPQRQRQANSTKLCADRIR
jgi:RecA-family ATPase